MFLNNFASKGHSLSFWQKSPTFILPTFGVLSLKWLTLLLIVSFFHFLGKLASNGIRVEVKLVTIYLMDKLVCLKIVFDSLR